MSKPIIDRSSERIGAEWRQEDHDALIHTLREVDNLVMGIYESHNAASRFSTTTCANSERSGGEMTKRKIYVASSWRNPIQQEIVRVLREAGHEVYDFRNPAPGNRGFAWSEVNQDWLNWTPEQFIADLYSGHPAVERGFAFDKAALDWSDTCVLVLPCGRSAHLEAGYAVGQGKLTLFYLHPDKFEPELMYLLGQGCVTDHAALLSLLDGREHREFPEEK